MKGKYVLLYIAAFLLYACGKRPDTNNSLTTPEVKYPYKCIDTFDGFFSTIDTSKSGNSIYCSVGLFKVINDSCLIWLKPEFIERTDSCFEYRVDSTNSGFAELIIFSNGKASLQNCCTDIITIIEGEPIPNKKYVQANSGNLIVGFSLPKTDNRHTLSIYIKSLLFIDKTTGNKIDIKDELLWKVTNLGTPG